MEKNFTQLPAGASLLGAFITTFVNTTTNVNEKFTLTQILEFIQDAIEADLNLPSDVAGVLSGTITPTVNTTGNVGDIYVKTSAPKAIYICQTSATGAHEWKDIQENAGDTAAVITGAAAPTTSTVGAIGDIYVKTAAPYNVYSLVNIAGSVYTWQSFVATTGSIVGCSVYKAGTISTDQYPLIYDIHTYGTGSASAKVAYNDGAYNATTGVYTVPEDGVYSITMNGVIRRQNNTGSPASIGGYIETVVKRSGTSVANVSTAWDGTGNNSTDAILNASEEKRTAYNYSKVIPLLAGDQISTYFTSSASPLNCEIGGSDIERICSMHIFKL